MKTQGPKSLIVRMWRRLMRRRVLAHDSFLSLSITLFNFSSGWDRLLQKQGHFSAQRAPNRRR
jgi:hypothetical protein